MQPRGMQLRLPDAPTLGSPTPAVTAEPSRELSSASFARGGAADHSRFGGGGGDGAGQYQQWGGGSAGPGHHQDGTGYAGLIAVHPWKKRFEQRYGGQYALLDEVMRMISDQ